MKEVTCCFSGHREIPAHEIPALTKQLMSMVKALISQGVVYFGAGGARGFDALAAQTVLRLRETHPHIRLVLVLPCRDQARNWPAADAALHRELQHRADKVVCLSERYYDGCMLARNRHLVDASRYLVCYLTRTNGGTAYTVNYARQKKLVVVNLASNEKAPA